MATLYGATLLAPVMDRIDSNEGERGNPWVLPWNPGRVDIWDRSSNGGWEAIDAAVRRATGDGIFLFILVLQMNGAALDIARVEGLRAAAAFYWMGCLLGGPRETDLAPKEWAEHKKEQASAWHSWRAVVAGLLATVMVEEDARTRLEGRYLRGQASLFADAETEWSMFAEIVDGLWSLSEKLVPLTPAEERRVSKDGGRLFDDRVQERAGKLADDARISTFDRLGEQRRALAILERRLAS